MSSRLRHHLDNSKEEELKLLPKHHDTDYVSFSSHANGEELDDQTESHFFGDNDDPEAVQAEAIDSSARGPSFYGAIAVLIAVTIIAALMLASLLLPTFKAAFRGMTITCEELNATWWEETFNTSTFNIISARGGYSAVINSTTAFWIFYDIDLYMKRSSSHTLVHRNVSAAIVTKQDTSIEPKIEWIVDESGAPMEMLSVSSKLYNESTTRTSPGAAFSLDMVLYLYYSVVEADRSLATGLGLMNISSSNLTFENAFDENRQIQNTPAGSVIDPNDPEHVYFYFLANMLYQDDKNEVYVARLRKNELLDSSMPFKYWTGNDWSLYAMKFPAVDSFGDEISVVWNEFLQMFVMLNSAKSSKLSTYTSTKPYKEWSLPTELYESKSSDTAFMDAYFHPELFDENGRIMYASVKNSKSPSIPKLMRITLTPEQSQST